MRDDHQRPRGCGRRVLSPSKCLLVITTQVPSLPCAVDRHVSRVRRGSGERPVWFRRRRRFLVHNAKQQRKTASCNVFALLYTRSKDGVLRNSTPCGMNEISLEPAQTVAKLTTIPTVRPCARGPGASAPTAGQGLWVLVFAGACQGTAWAGLCFVHHHHRIGNHHIALQRYATSAAKTPLYRNSLGAGGA